MSLVLNILSFISEVGADIKALYSQLSSKLNKSGGVMTGKLTGNHVSSKASSFKTHYLSVTTGTKNLDLSEYSIFEYTITGNSILNFNNLPEVTDETLIFILRLTMGATLRTITFNNSITWLTQDGVVPPVPTINKTKEYVLTYYGGVFTGRVVPFY